MSGSEGDPGVSSARLEEYEWNLRCSKLTSSFSIGKKLLSIATDVLEMNPLDGPISSSRITSFVQAMLPHSRSVFNDSFLLMPTFPVRILMDTLDLYELFPMAERVKNYFEKDELDDENVKYIIWFASFYDSSRDFLLAIFKQYKALTDFIWKDIGKDKTHIPEQFDEDENTPEVSRQNVEPVAQRRPTAAVVTEKPVSVPPSQPRPVNPQAPVGVQVSASQENPPEPTRDQPGPSSLPPYVSIQPLSSPHPYEGDPSKKLTAVQSYFRDKQFDGSMSVSIHRVIRDYELCAKQIKLTTQLKADLFINVFTGAARDFFYDHCRDDMNFKQLADVMLREYDSDARRLGVQSELEILTIEQFMADRHITDDVVGLTKIVEHINTLTPQCPPNFRTETNKIRFLRHAVLMQPWADKAVSNITSAKYTFNAFVTALREQLQLEIEKKSRGSNSVTSTHYQRYGRAPLRKKSERIVGKNPVGRDGKRMLCKLCGGDDHFMRDCKEKSVKEYAHRQLQNGIPAVHVLHDLAIRMDNLCHDSEREEDETHATGHVDGQNSELAAFEALDDNDDGGDDDKEHVPSDINVFEALDSASATHHIASSMKSSMDFQ